MPVLPLLVVDGLEGEGVALVQDDRSFIPPAFAAAYIFKTNTI